MLRPIITLTTDFGEGSPYVAQMKASILSLNREAVVVDVTHSVAPQDIRHGALVLADVSLRFAPGAIHVAVVDPGVGTRRAIVCLEMGGHRFVAPDNGLLSWVARRTAPERIVRVTNSKYWAPNVSATFHGRDIMAPVAAHLSLGVDLTALGPLCEDFQRLDYVEPRSESDRIEGAVVLIDSFGNLITNIMADQLEALTDAGAVSVECGGCRIRGLIRTYAEAATASLVALVGSSGRLEIAEVDGNAAQRLGAAIDDRVVVRR